MAEQLAEQRERNFRDVAVDLERRARERRGAGTDGEAGSGARAAWWPRGRRRDAGRRGVHREGERPIVIPMKRHLQIAQRPPGDLQRMPRELQVDPGVGRVSVDRRRQLELPARVERRALTGHAGDRAGDGRHVDLAGRQVQLQARVVLSPSLPRRRPGGGEVELRVDGVSERARGEAALQPGGRELQRRDRDRPPPPPPARATAADGGAAPDRDRETIRRSFPPRGPFSRSARRL